MSRKERLDKEIDILLKMVIFLMTVSGAIIAYSYIHKDVIALFAVIVPVIFTIKFYSQIERDLDELEDK